MQEPPASVRPAARPGLPSTRPVTLGLDLGTSGLKGVALDAAGTVMAEAGASYELLTPQPGWTEQRPEDWVRAAREVLGALAAQLSQVGATAVALGLSGQMHGLVALDRGGEVLRPALLWNDQRTAVQVQAIETRIPRQELVARTGNRAVSGFQLPKLLWLRDEEPQLFARTRHALLPKDYLGYVLTGQLASEPSDASGVGALNLMSGRWDGDVLDALGLDAGLFPELQASVSVVGTLGRAWADATGLPGGLMVVAGGGDNAAAATALGLSADQPQRGSLSLGTSGVIFAPLLSPTPDPQGRVHLFAHTDGGFHLLGVTLAAAGALEWFRQTLAPEVSAGALIAEAEGVPGGAGGLSFLPYLAGERSPLMNPDARGVFAGLSLAHTRAHMVRAVLEGTAAALQGTWAVMAPLAGVSELLSTGGGARSAFWLGLVSRALGLPVRPSTEQAGMGQAGAAHGAAILAMPAAGLHKDLKAAMSATRPQAGEAVPPQDLGAALEQYARVQRVLYPAALDAGV